MRFDVGNPVAGHVTSESCTRLFAMPGTDLGPLGERSTGRTAPPPSRHRNCPHQSSRGWRGDGVGQGQPVDGSACWRNERTAAVRQRARNSRTSVLSGDYGTFRRPRQGEGSHAGGPWVVKNGRGKDRCTRTRSSRWQSHTRRPGASNGRLERRRDRGEGGGGTTPGDEVACAW